MLKKIAKRFLAWTQRNRGKVKAFLGAVEGCVLNVVLLVVQGQSPEVLLSWTWKRWALGIAMVVLPMLAHGLAHAGDLAAPAPRALAPVDPPKAA